MDLLNEIDKYLLRKASEKRTAYYPSEVNKCLRQLYYKWVEEPETDPIDAGGYWKMRMGDKIHDLIHEFLVKMEYEIINEVSFKKDIDLSFPLSGRIDNLFIDEDNAMAGIEIKTSYGAGIKNIQKRNKPRAEDLNQIAVYMVCGDINRFYLIYIGRDNAYRTQFVIEKEEEKFYINHKYYPIDTKKLLIRFKLLERHVTLGVLPEQEYVVPIKNGEIKDFQKNYTKYKVPWQCSYCVFKTKCWEEELKKYEDTDNSKELEEILCQEQMN